MAIITWSNIQTVDSKSYTCGHCGKKECAHKKKHSVLPHQLDTATVMDVLNELAEGE